MNYADYSNYSSFRLTIPSEDVITRTCCFVGDVDSDMPDFDIQKLDDCILTEINKMIDKGYDTFITYYFPFFNSRAAKILHRLKMQGKIHAQLYTISWFKFGPKTYDDSLEEWISRESMSFCYMEDGVPEVVTAMAHYFSDICGCLYCCESSELYNRCTAHVELKQVFRSKRRDGFYWMFNIN